VARLLQWLSRLNSQQEMKWGMRSESFNMGTPIKRLLGYARYRPIVARPSNNRIHRAFWPFIHLLIILLIPGGILISACWWAHYHRSPTLRPPAREALLSGEKRPEKVP
jgi:hypothetical protein